MSEEKGVVKEGDIVILFCNHESLVKTRLTQGDVVQFKAGKYRHSEIIGKKYGSRIEDLVTRVPNLTVLPWTPELHSLSLDHRTQILWAPDISLISAYLCLKAGSILVESGTGSGSATVNFARQVGPDGHIHTFEYHQGRHKAALEEFEELQLQNVITCYNRNVYKDGFSTITEENHPEYGTYRAGGVPEAGADGVFLDLPSPWLALKHADYVLKPNSRVVIFSPCFEQVQTVAKELRAMEYTDIEGFEVICKPIGIWTPLDAERKAQRVLKSRKRNFESRNTLKAPKEIEREVERIFDCAPYVLHHLPLKGHTGYIIVATKVPKIDHSLVEIV